jgi:ferredoxin-NADP reductase
VQTRQETRDVRTFVLRAETPRSFRYRPGQFLTFALDIDGQRIERCYTMASSPTRPDTVSITVKRVPGGPVSNWLHDHLRPGMRLSARGPGGEFSCFGAGAASGRALLFLSGGSGITPLMSMSRAFHDLAGDVDLLFVHAARTPLDVIFADELVLMSRNLPRWRHALICEQRGEAAAYAGLLGRLNLPLLQSVAPDFMQRDVYCCGPAPMMAGVREMLRLAGYAMEHYHEESFAFEARSVAAETGEQAASPAPGTSVADFEIRFARSDRAFRCAADQTLLKAATAAGLRVPFSCAQGVCGTCRTLKVSGDVDMQHGGGLRPREVNQGWILPCCSKPLANVVLDR